MIPPTGAFSVCVSTQIGCAMNCAFCRTAKMATRNLGSWGAKFRRDHRGTGTLRTQERSTATETRAQVTNIIFMGMGEPLNNLENDHRVCCTLHNQKLFSTWAASG